MMMKIKICIVLCCIFSISCTKSFLDKKPHNSTTHDKIFKTHAGITSALNGCYNDLQSHYYYGRNFLLIQDIFTDNAKLSKQNLGNFSSFYNHSITTDNEELKQLWATGYKIISNTNRIIASVDSIPTLTIAHKKIILGESLCLRALVYYDLVRMFAHHYSISAHSNVPQANGKGAHAGIPLITTVNHSDTIHHPSRSSVAAVYKQILSDLHKADSLLENFPFTPNRCNHIAAKALIAKIFLDYKEYNKCLHYAEQILQSSNFELLSYNNYLESWGQDYTSESILSITMTPTDYPGTNSIGHMLSPEGYGGIVPTKDLTDLFAANDVRIGFLKKIQEDFFIKYPGRQNTLGLDNIPVLRLSEIYFIIAECYAMKAIAVSSFYPFAQQALEKITQRAENNNVLITLTHNDLTQKIHEEYRKEFAFEGKRLFQLKRLGADIYRTDCISTSCSLSYPNYKFAFPIPLAEILVNTNMSQNYQY